MFSMPILRRFVYFIFTMIIAAADIDIAMPIRHKDYITPAISPD